MHSLVQTSYSRLAVEERLPYQSKLAQMRCLRGEIPTPPRALAALKPKIFRGARQKKASKATVNNACPQSLPSQLGCWLERVTTDLQACPLTPLRFLARLKRSDHGSLLSEPRSLTGVHSSLLLWAKAVPLHDARTRKRMLSSSYLTPLDRMRFGSFTPPFSQKPWSATCAVRWCK